MCAQRYQQWSSGPHLLTGQCYLLGDNLRVGEEERTWRRVVCDSEHLSRRHNDHEWFAYCQQGHGASFAKDNRSLLFGAPGAYQWRGEVQLKMPHFCTVPTKRSELTIYNRCCCCLFFSVDKFILYRKPLSHPYFSTSYIASAIYQYRNRASDTFMLFFFCYVIFFKGIVRMDPLDDLVFSSESSRETGDIDQFQPKLIPLKTNSYLGQCLIRSKSVWAAKLCFS